MVPELEDDGDTPNQKVGEILKAIGCDEIRFIGTRGWYPIGAVMDHLGTTDEAEIRSGLVAEDHVQVLTAGRDVFAEARP